MSNTRLTSLPIYPSSGPTGLDTGLLARLRVIRRNLSPRRLFLLVTVFLLTLSFARAVFNGAGSSKFSPVYSTLVVPAQVGLDASRKAAGHISRPFGHLRNVLAENLGGQWTAHIGPEDRALELRKKDLLKDTAPTVRMRENLRDDLRYITALAYGGHANQFISTGKMLTLAKITGRVAIVPSLIPVHFNGGMERFSTFFDLPRFYKDSKIPVVEMEDIKPLDITGRPQEVRALTGDPWNERISCWSTQEATAGHPNLWAATLHSFNVWVDYWPLPAMTRGLGGFDLAFDALKIFDFDAEGRRLWIERVRKEALPQQKGVYTGPPELNMKPDFNTTHAAEPDDKIMCLDNTLFLGPVSFPKVQMGDVPHEEKVPGEGMPFKEATQHIHFSKKVEGIVDKYLMRLFEVATPTEIPPFISVHLRRGDFQAHLETGGAEAATIAHYKDAVERVRSKLQRRIDDPNHWLGPGRKNFKTYGIPASEYAVLTTTDEHTGSPFIQSIRDLGWRVLDHEEAETEKTLGGWWPTILDSAILARGSSFVGTEGSTFSHLAGMRVKYWQGGVVEVAT